ncbi:MULTISPECIES: glycine betaine ABC transporter substrate-binding protein [Paenibacillus]|uniref:Glycine/betaine ABC transporter substrate-binding protein n=1 Tax=Paenibacillus campinasensis TaxID=66347 RepID=A0A268ERK1_9BACL|nr:MULTISPECIES: glycine betaine ABC transporter substrate-binding protein [Paenibacillus]MUG66254.1 glycine/betaine ABC transporter substrate-binding protein [Paenibacillus campinasensis]PAD75759.1 glycine/betaine ABC transporter substrate-binding protein [Paenibacillus campinasensis]PAK54540.1 glycine/betaine ABC transporter substrate-binding protein [Paenibacillus sp. 7541]
MGKRNFALAFMLALPLLLSSCTNPQAQTGNTGPADLVIGSKNFTENIILAHMMADLIEDRTGLTVRRTVNLGGSSVTWKALLNNDIQLYPEYTGTIVANYYLEETGTAEETLERTKTLLAQDNLEFLEPLGFNNSYALAVTPETAEQYNLRTFSDLAKVSAELELGAEFEFTDRPDTYPGLRDLYNMHFKRVKGMDQGIKYRLIAQNDLDVASAYTTDGQIKVINLVILEDDKGFFPPYHAGPVVRDDLLARYPEIRDALNELGGKISEEDMQELNARVDEGYREDIVARDFLIEIGLLQK